MSYLPLAIAFLIAIVDWVAVAKDWRTVEYIAKPGVMLALIAWIILSGGTVIPFFWFLLGLALSLAGDVFLMLPREQFIAGLIAFLLAHVAYLTGFLSSYRLPLNLPALILVTLVLLTASQIYRRIAAGLVSKQLSSLRIPVLVYTIVISLMLITALFTLLSKWEALNAILVSLGALLFFLSDALLAWNKFVSPFRLGRVPNIVAYHLGQILLTLGVILHFAG